jgi:integrase
VQLPDIQMTGLVPGAVIRIEGATTARLTGGNYAAIRATVTGERVTPLGQWTEWITAAAGRAGKPSKNPTEWTPRELRHSFVSVLSDAGVPLEQISQLVGHSGTTVTELVYRHQLRPVVQTGATVMHQLFDQRDEQA